MLTPKDYIGPLMELSQDRRGEFKEMKFITENRASLTYELPLAEVPLVLIYFRRLLHVDYILLQLLHIVSVLLVSFFNMTDGRRLFRSVKVQKQRLC